MNFNGSMVCCPGVNSTNCADADLSFYTGKYGSSPVENNFSDLFASCNCTNWYKDTKDGEAIAIIRIITSVFSIMGAASIILSVLLTGKLSAAEVHPLFILSVADFILSILWLIGGIVWLEPGGGGWATPDSDPHTGMCYVLAVSTTIMEIVAFLLTAVYAQSALLRVREVYLNRGYILSDMDPRKKVRHVFTVVVYIASWILPLVIVLPTVESIIGIESTNKGCWCVLDFFNLRPDNGFYGSSNKFNKFAMTQATILGVSFIVISICISIFYVLTFLYALKVIRLQSDLSEINGERLIRTIVKRLSLFLGIFLVSGLPAIFASFLVWAEKERLQLDETIDRIVLYFHAIFGPLQGFLNAVVYGWSRKEFRRAVYRPGRTQHSRRNQDYQSLNHSSGRSDLNT